MSEPTLSDIDKKLDTLLEHVINIEKYFKIDKRTGSALKEKRTVTTRNATFLKRD